MSLATFIDAMPKVELNVHLEGAVQKKTLQMIAEQNEIPTSLKHYSDWLNLLDKPDYKRIYELIRIVGGWMTDPEDLTRLVYDVGTTLAKQNVRYAEVSVNPATYSALELSTDDFLTAINDGRDRAQRAWGIELAWLFVVPREEPRRGDEIARWFTAANAKRNNVVGLALTGRESVQPVGQFERAFRAVEKKGILRAVRAGESLGGEGIQKAIEALAPNRIFDAWGLADAPDVMTLIADQQIGVGISLTRALKQGWIHNIAEYPLRTLYDAAIPVFLGSDMPFLYHSTLNDEYLAAEKCGMGVEEIQAMAINAVRYSFLPDERKAEMLTQFEGAYAALRDAEKV